MTNELKDRQIGAERVMFKVPTIPKEVREYEEPVNLDELVSDVTLKKLNDIFRAIMRRQANKVDPIRSKFGNIEKFDNNQLFDKIFLSFLKILSIDMKIF